MRIAIAVALCLAACGGSSLSPAAAKIREGDESSLTDCQQLEQVTGTSSASDNNTAQREAKHDALEKAAKLGATHIRWIVPCCTSVEAQAYKCETPID
jgi:hypothetical protein